MTVFLQMLKKR